MTSVILLIGLCCIFGIKNKTWILIIPLVFFVYPQQATESIGSLERISVLVNYVPIVISVIILFHGLNNNSIIIWKEKIGILFCAILLIMVSFSYSLMSNDKADVRYIIFFIMLYVMYYYVVRKYKISCFLYFYALDIVFFVMSVYTVLEYFWNYSPYDSIYYALTKTDYYETTDFFRAKSLCGHPLLLVGFLTLYQTSLYTRLLVRKGRWLEFFCLFLSFVISSFTLSRTSYIIEIFIFVIWCGSYYQKNIRRNLSTFIIIALLIVIVLNYSMEYLNLTLERFDNSETSEKNRLAAFQVAFVIFQNEPYGVGVNLRNLFSFYRDQMSSEFTVDVLDNAFLAILCQYGVFSVFFFKMMATPVIDTYRRIKENYYLRKAFWILTFSLLLLSFSFITTAYKSLLVLSASMFAVLCQLSPRESVNNLNNNIKR